MERRRSCGYCRYFDNSPEAFERAFPGLVSFGSGSASVRDEDGICRLHERHLSNRSSCERYETALVRVGGAVTHEAGALTSAPRTP